MRKIFLHIYGIKKFFLYGLRAVLNLCKAIAILFAVMTILTVTLHGIDGLKEYLNAVNYLALIKEVLVFMASIFILFFTFVVGYNIYLSFSYCSNKPIKLIDFYKKEKEEIIAIWVKGRQ